MSPHFIVGLRCPYCQKFRAPAEIIRWPGGLEICVECEQRHQEALRALSTGEFRGLCSECGQSWFELGAVNLQMAIHYENGRYRLMCLKCNEQYVPKRMELYRGTEYGRSLGLD